jgi:hypothetical protein
VDQGMASFLNRMFGSQGDKAEKIEIYPIESFSVFEAKLVDGRPMIGSFNMAYRDYNLKDRFPWCLKLGIGLDEGNLYDNGLPLGDESYIANRFEDRLIEAIRVLSTTHYIGHVFNDSFLDVYVHLDDPEPAHQYLQDLIAREDHVRGFGYEIKNDPEWFIVGEFIGE